MVEGSLNLFPDSGTGFAVLHNLSVLYPTSILKVS